jgi:diaminopimelate decarboxylase
MGVFQYRNGILCCESAPLDRIARTVGTPFFVYSRKRLIANWNAAEKPLARTPHLTCYAVKANANPHLIRLFAERGAGVDIVSGGELRLALLAGVPADRVLFSGVGKTDAEIGAAVTAGVYSLNVESFDELSAVSRVAVRVRKKARVSIRVNPRVDPRTHPYIATGLRESKFGIAAERAVEAFRLAASLPGITVAGVHCHIGSQILETAPFSEAAESIVRLVRELRSERIRLEFIDLGGGWGIDYQRIVETGVDPNPGRPMPPGPAGLFHAILPVLAGTGCRLLFEPGRFLVADAGALIASVTYNKDNGGRRFVILDAGMNDLIRPSLYDAYHQIVPVLLKRGRPEGRADIVGPICESGDFFAHDRPLPAVRRGELLAITGAGAYGYSLSSNYNGRPRAAEVLVSGTGFKMIRQRESIDVLWNGTGFCEK